MVAPAILALLTWLHIFSVVSWLGAAIILTLVIEPVMDTLSPQSQGEMGLKLLPRMLRFVQVFAGLTLLFGFLLALAISDGNLSTFTSTSFGAKIDIGAILGLFVFIMIFAVLTPGIKKIAKLVLQMQQNPGQPPPAEMRMLLRRMKIGGPLAITFLSVAMAFMVAAVWGVP